MAKKNKIRAIGIVARQWRDRYGNTYYAADILVNGIHHKRIGPFYGYGDQYLYDAFNVLAADRVITLAPGRTETHVWPCDYCTDHGIALFTSMTDVQKRRDLMN